MSIASKDIQSGKRDLREKVRVLEQVAIFQAAHEDILIQLAQSLEDVFVAKDESVFHKGDRLKAMYIIVEGRVNVHDGDHIFTSFEKNDFFGEYSLIDSSVRSATVTAIEDTALLKLNQDAFHAIMDKNAEVARAVLKSLIKRLRNSNILEEQLTQYSLKIKRQRDELEEQSQRLKELNATKDKFFTIIAHDLKNPFNTVIGLSELLMLRYEQYDEEKIKDFIGQINNFSNNAYSLLENLLQWAKSQTGRININPQKIDLLDIVQENLALLKGKADEKSIMLNSEIEKGCVVYADLNMLRTILRNLMSNALKFTHSGGYIRVDAAKRGEFYEIHVEDNGVGIPEENQEKLFKIDSNVSTKGTADEAGTGLGLILVKEFVEKNGGSIHVSSEPGKGSRFFFTLPAVS